MQVALQWNEPTPRPYTHDTDIMGIQVRERLHYRKNTEIYTTMGKYVVEFCSVIVVTVCIRPSADAEGLRDITQSTVACLLIQHFSAFKVMTGDFTEHYHLLNSILIVLACCMEIVLDTDCLCLCLCHIYNLALSRYRH